MPAYLIVSLLLAVSTSAALAHVFPPVPVSRSEAVVQVQMGAPAAAPKKGRAGGKAAPETEKAASDSLKSCLAMWEPATHMSRQEWGRACRRVDERLRNITAK